MDPGKVPPELNNLTYIEQMLIAQIHPIVSIYRIRGGQYAYSGNIINFKQNIEHYIEKLPIHPKDLPSTIIFHKHTPSGIVDFQARTKKIRKALLWLKKHNIYYRHIEIDEEVLNIIPEDGNIVNLLQSLDVEINNDNKSNEDNNDDNDDIVVNNVPTVEIINQKNHIDNTLELDYPTLSTEPINEFRTEGYISRAFPCLLPTGQADYTQNRTIPVTLDEYFKFLMCYEDERFAKDPRFRFFCMNTIMRHKLLKQSGIFVKKSKLGKITLDELKDLLKTNKSVWKNIMVYCSKIRSTKSYWYQRCDELLTMVEQINTPTVFFTLSAADHQWKDLNKLINQNADNHTLTDQEKAKLLQENPLKVAYYFQKRVDLFMKNVLIPVFDVEDFWYRFEWQFRGSPHIHGVLHIKNAPIFKEHLLNQERLQNICKYFDNLCFAVNPNHDKGIVHPAQKNFSDVAPENLEKDLTHLINTLQRHTKHGRHCLRQNKKSKILKCRFNFPKECSQDSNIDNSEGYLRYQPQRNDPLIQRYNPIVTLIWRANTDFSPIISKTAVLHYIAHYASKCEVSSKTYIQTLTDICKSASPETTTKTIVQKLFISTLGERDYSAQEVVHILMSWPLYHCSRNFRTLFIREDDNWEELQVGDSTEEIKTSSSLLENYKNRPTQYQNLSLIKFAQDINVIRKKYTTRRKSFIVRIFPKLKLSINDINNEKFYKQQCTLQIPFITSIEDIRLKFNANTKWQDIFESYDLKTNDNVEISNIIDEDITPEGINDIIVRNPFESLSSLSNSIQENQLGRRLIDENYEWDSRNSNTPDYDEISTFLNVYKTKNVTKQETITQLKYSEDQQKILNSLDTQLLQIRNKTCNNKTIKRIIVQGKAGSGKSTVIQEMIKRIKRNLRNENSVAVAAPTGSAAVNINGRTLHSLFRLPLYAKDFTTLNQETAKHFQEELQELHFLIIDEMSMIGLNLLFMIEQRCREIFPTINEPFGRLFVYFFGDVCQLSPVGDHAMYTTREFSENLQKTKGKLIFKQIQKFFYCKMLTDNMGINHYSQKFKKNYQQNKFI